MAAPEPRAFATEAAQDRLFEALVENSFDTIAIVDESAVHRWVSPSVKRMLGWDPEDLVGRSTFEFIHPSQQEWAAEMLQKILADEAFDEALEVEVLHKNGSWRLIEVAVTNLVNDPDIEGIVCNYRDITERRHWENALRESEERYQKAFRASPDGIAISRLRDGVFVDVNEGFEELTGFSRDELIGRSTLDLKHWKNPADRERLVEELRQSRVVKDFQAEFLDRNGQVHIGQLSVDTLELNGETHMLSTIRDVTQQIVPQEKLARATEEISAEHRLLLEKNRALRELLDHLQEDKATYRHELTATIDNLLRPLIRRLKERGGRLTPAEAELLAHRLDMIKSRDLSGFTDNLAKLSPRERDVCALIQEGRSSREIAYELGLSPETVNKHRQSIRRKLQIDHRGINLTSYLRSR